MYNALLKIPSQEKAVKKKADDIDIILLQFDTSALSPSNEKELIAYLVPLNVSAPIHP
jgi:hypothetical protein